MWVRNSSKVSTHDYSLRQTIKTMQSLLNQYPTEMKLRYGELVSYPQKVLLIINKPLTSETLQVLDQMINSLSGFLREADNNNPKYNNDIVVKLSSFCRYLNRFHKYHSERSLLNNTTSAETLPELEVRKPQQLMSKL